MITNIKLKVTPEQSRRVQKIAFKNGVYWSTRNVVSYENKPYLYIRRGYISHGTELSTYENSNFEEMDANLFIQTNGTGIGKILKQKALKWLTTTSR